jgi:uncharacterized protein (UPF0335 family)
MDANNAKQTIRQAVQEIERIEAEIADLQLDKRTFEKSIVDVGIPKKYLNTIRGLKKLDADKRDEAIDALHLTAEALGVQLDLGLADTKETEGN